MIIFGIDPGTTITGYGVIRVDTNRVSWIDSGVIKPGKDGQLADKLADIYDGLLIKLKQHLPQRVCVEQAFYAKNVRTTLILGHARGVALLAAKHVGAEVAEYSPREIKKSVVGNGNADKQQVEYMIKALLAVPTQHEHSDAYDALAAALCDFQNYRYRATLAQRSR
ncbi:MAG TPA: crossover junction endodeoxyribonuclease RuvC [Chitinivibrionales bacterium]